MSGRGSLYLLAELLNGHGLWAEILILGQISGVKNRTIGIESPLF